jgi:hypothetical protein
MFLPQFREVHMQISRFSTSIIINKSAVPEYATCRRTDPAVQDWKRRKVSEVEARYV